MRHRKAGRQLGRNSSHRKAMFRNMVTSLLEHGRIKTTDAKANELRRLAARMITLGKKGSIHARRLAAKTIRSETVIHKLFTEIAPGFQDRHGGYTRIIKLGKPRVGDNAQMSIIELMPAGSPELKGGRKPVAAAPKVTAPVAMPETKETFSAKAEKAEEAPAEEAAAEEAPAEEAAAEEADDKKDEG